MPNYLYNNSKETKDIAESAYIQWKKTNYKNLKTNYFLRSLQNELINYVNKELPTTFFNYRFRLDWVSILEYFSVKHKLIKDEYLQILMPLLLDACKKHILLKAKYLFEALRHEQKTIIINFSQKQLSDIFDEVFLEKGLQNQNPFDIYLSESEKELTKLHQALNKKLMHEVKITFNPKLFQANPQITSEIVQYAGFLACKEIAYNIISANSYANPEISNQLLSFSDASEFLAPNKKSKNRIANFNDDLLIHYVDLAKSKFEANGKYLHLMHFAIKNVINKNDEVYQLLNYIEQQTPFILQNYGEYENDFSWTRTKSQQALNATSFKPLSWDNSHKKGNETALNNFKQEIINENYKVIEDQFNHLTSKLENQISQTERVSQRKLENTQANNFSQSDIKEMIDAQLVAFLNSLPKTKEPKQQEYAYSQPVAINLSEANTSYSEQDENEDVYLENNKQSSKNSKPSESINERFNEDYASIASELYDTESKKAFLDFSSINERKGLIEPDVKDKREHQAQAASINDKHDDLIDLSPEEATVSKVSFNLNEADEKAITLLNTKLEKLSSLTNKEDSSNIKLLISSIRLCLDFYMQVKKDNSTISPESKRKLLTNARQSAINILKQIKDSNY